MASELDPETTWRKLPKDLKSKLRDQVSHPLTDELLRECHQAAEKSDLPIFWRPDPATDYTEHRLHPDLAAYISRTR